MDKKLNDGRERKACEVPSVVMGKKSNQHEGGDFKPRMILLGAKPDLSICE